MAAKINLAILWAVQLKFLETFTEHGTEDRVLIYRSDSGDLWAQQAGGVRRRASVQGDVPLAIPHGGRLWDLAYDLHSHHEMGAFWSSTDSANERIRGVTFGVFSWKDCQPTWLFRRFTGEVFEDLPVEEVVVSG